MYWLLFLFTHFFSILLFLCNETAISVHMWEVLPIGFWIIQDQEAKSGWLLNWISSRYFVWNLGISPGMSFCHQGLYKQKAKTTSTFKRSWFEISSRHAQSNVKAWQLCMCVTVTVIAYSSYINNTIRVDFNLDLGVTCATVVN